MGFSNVPTTTVTILQSEIDYFTWPCISGEKYPPTLGTGWAYGVFNGFTCVQEIGAASNTTVSWPNLPLIRPTNTSFTGFTASLLFASGGSTGGASGFWYTLTFPGGMQISLGIASDNVTCQYTSGGTLPLVSNSALSNFNDSTFHVFSMAVTGTSINNVQAIFSIDGVAIHTFTNFSLSGTAAQFSVNRNTAGTLIQYVSSPYLLYS